MSRFYFHCSDGVDLVLDREGIDPASPRERQREHVCEFQSADDLASDVADDAAEHRAEAPQGSVARLNCLAWA